MSEHHVTVDWKLETEGFGYKTYNRDHDWTFDAGLTVRASAAPQYLGNASCVDPEEAYLASLVSCHMLTFLAVASRRNFMVQGYHDEATAVMEKNAEGKMAVTRVTLRPQVSFGGEAVPCAEEIDKLHAAAHHGCFLAHSVKTEIVIEARL